MFKRSGVVTDTRMGLTLWYNGEAYVRLLWSGLTQWRTGQGQVMGAREEANPNTAMLQSSLISTKCCQGDQL